LSDYVLTMEEKMNQMIHEILTTAALDPQDAIDEAMTMKRQIQQSS
jgi:hypothetical protein